MALRIATQSDIDKVNRSIRQKNGRRLSVTDTAYTKPGKIKDLKKLGVNGLTEGWSPRVFVATDHVTVPPYYGSSQIYIIAEPGIIVKTGGHNELYKLDTSNVKIKGQKVSSKYLIDRPDVKDFNLYKDTASLYAAIMVLHEHGVFMFDSVAQEAKKLGETVVSEAWKLGPARVKEQMAELERLATDGRAFKEKTDLGFDTMTGAPALKIANVILKSAERTLKKKQHIADGMERYDEFIALGEEMFSRYSGYQKPPKSPEPKVDRSMPSQSDHYDLLYAMKQSRA